eukprot:8013329-Lingulodinium_polyedra.AAC.1
MRKAFNRLIQIDPASREFGEAKLSQYRADLRARLPEEERLGVVLQEVAQARARFERAERHRQLAE